MSDVQLEPEGIKARERAEKIVQMARDEYYSGGAIEIDETDDPVSQLSEGEDNGCYVKAWVWVDFEGTEFDKESEKGHD